MPHRNQCLILIGICALLSVPISLEAQATQQKNSYPVFELGGLVTGVAGNGLGGTAGVAGRATYLFYHDPQDDEIQGMVGIEGEFNWLPVDKQPSVFSGGRVTQGLVRLKVEIGDVNERIGLKLGSGFVSSQRVVRAFTFTGNPFAPAATPARFGRLTDPAIEFGVLLEKYRSGSHWGYRFDAGDVIIIYPDLPGADSFRARHSFQVSAALVYRFPIGAKQ